MIDYKAIKEVLREGIWRDLRRFFVDLENGDSRPDTQEGLPEELKTFISHKFISPYTPQVGYELNDGETLELVSNPTITVSLTVYSKDKGEALNLAHRLMQWFRFNGYEYLKEHDLIVESIEPMQDRTVFLETTYDHRVGFDVVLRTTDKAEKKIDVIEQVELNDELIGG